MRSLVLLAIAALALGSEAWLEPSPPPPLAGFSFSPLTSLAAGRDPEADLDLLLDATEPDVVRLPIYWDLVEPEPGDLDFSSVDALMAVVAQHDRITPVKTRVVLTVGARNFLYPELYVPDWAQARGQPGLELAQTGAAYRQYFDQSIVRYRPSSLLYAWQIENEPLDKVGDAESGDDRISDQQLAWEMAEVHVLDPKHQAVTTTYNGLNTAVDLLELWAPRFVTHVGTVGHPEGALEVGDALGLDVYIDGPSVPLRHVTTTSLRLEWKQQTVALWATRASAAGKSVWLTEVQAQPWDSRGAFGPSDLVASASSYRQESLGVVLLWGVETWLAQPAWMNAGAQAIAILRGNAGS